MFAGIAAQNKFKNLKDTFNEHSNKIKDSMRSGAGAADVPTVKWAHFKSMMSLMGPVLKEPMWAQHDFSWLSLLLQFRSIACKKWTKYILTTTKKNKRTHASCIQQVLPILHTQCWQTNLKSKFILNALQCRKKWITRYHNKIAVYKWCCIVLTESKHCDHVHWRNDYK